MLHSYLVSTMNELARLADCAAELLTNQEAYRERISHVLSDTISNFGNSASVEADYIISRLKERRKNGS